MDLNRPPLDIITKLKMYYYVYNIDLLFFLLVVFEQLFIYIRPGLHDIGIAEQHL